MNINTNTALVTGGANGIGRQIAIQLANEGATVFVADTDSDNGQLLENGHRHIRYIHADMGQEADILSVFEQIEQDGRTLDIVINNVGISKFKPLIELTTHEWDTIVNVNLRAAFICSREFAKRHRTPSYGRIINIASTRHLMSEPGAEAYAASKGGLVSITHALAASLAHTGITVNCISPGWIHTGDASVLSPADHLQHFSGRVGTPADIASMCLYLCRPDSDFINGQNIYIDGGITKKMIYD